MKAGKRALCFHDSGFDESTNPKLSGRKRPCRASCQNHRLRLGRFWRDFSIDSKQLS